MPVCILIPCSLALVRLLACRPLRRLCVLPSDRSPAERTHMEDEKKKERKYFIIVNGVKYEVDEAIYRLYVRPNNATRKQAQRRGECCCLKEEYRFCDGICPGCRFYVRGNRISIDQIIEAESDESGDLIELQEAVTDYSQAPEFLMLEKELIETIHKAIHQLDPESRALCILLMRYPERKVASILGMPKTSVRRRWESIKERLKTFLKDNYL